MGKRSIQEVRKPFEAIVTTRPGPCVLGQHPHKAVIYVWMRKHFQITAERFPKLFEAVPGLRIAESDGCIEREVTVCSVRGLRREKSSLAGLLRTYTDISVITQ